MSLKLQLLTVRGQGIEGIAREHRAKGRGVNGGFMLLSCRMDKLGRLALICFVN